MKEVAGRDLKVGDEVWDINEPRYIEGTVLRLVKKDELGDPLFERVSGSSCYDTDDNGLIPFSGGVRFYMEEDV